MKLNAISTVLIAISVLTGCAVAYVEPIPKSNTTLRLENQTAAATAKFGTFDDGEHCKASTVRRITLDSSGNWEIDAGQSFTIRIKPNEAFTLDVHDSVGTKTCTVRVTFRPKVDKEYVATLSDDSKKCYLSIQRIEGNKYVPEESAIQRENLAGLLHGGNSCE